MCKRTTVPRRITGPDIKSPQALEKMEREGGSHTTRDRVESDYKLRIIILKKKKNDTSISVF